MTCPGPRGSHVTRPENEDPRKVESSSMYNGRNVDPIVLILARVLADSHPMKSFFSSSYIHTVLRDGTYLKICCAAGLTCRIR